MRPRLLVTQALTAFGLVSSEGDLVTADRNLFGI